MSTHNQAINSDPFRYAPWPRYCKSYAEVIEVALPLIFFRSLVFASLSDEALIVAVLISQLSKIYDNLKFFIISTPKPCITTAIKIRPSKVSVFFV